MADIEKIIDGLNIPKQVLDKSEALLKTLFGPSFEEFGGILADQVKLRRFNNQIKIFTKAQEKLRQNNIDPKRISLKILAPLIELSSLEENENLQEKWANLISQILSGNREIVFQQNCIEILHKLSSEEAKLIDSLHSELLEQNEKRYKVKLDHWEKMKKEYPQSNIGERPTFQEYPLKSSYFTTKKIAKDLNVLHSEIEFSISNLISLGLFRWEVGVDAQTSDHDLEKINVTVYNSEVFVFTSVGDKFVKMCKG